MIVQIRYKGVQVYTMHILRHSFKILHVYCIVQTDTKRKAVKWIPLGFFI